MDGDEGKTFYVIRFLDHFFENLVIYGSGPTFIPASLHDPTRTTIGSDFYTCTIRPDPMRTGDPIRRGLAIRSDYYTCLPEGGGQ